MTQVESESVEKWLGRLDESWRYRARNILMNFMMWLGDNSTKFANFNPDMLVEYQREAENGELYDILDEVQRYVQDFDIRYSSKVKYYSTIRAFFAHNRSPLPDDPGFQLRSDKPSISGELLIEELRDLLLNCNECYRAVFLSMFQGAMDQASFIFWNENGWDKLREDLNGDPEVIRVDLPGRKKTKNKRAFYTLIGGDSITAIRNWLKIRPDEIPLLNEDGKPKLNEGNEEILIKNPYVFTNQSRQPIKKSGLYMLWRRTLQRLGYVDRSNGEAPVWSGKGPHEMRDTFRSMWEKSPAKASVAEFLMGHQVDSLEYNKAFRDENWTRGEYLKALPMFQIMSSGRPFGLIEEEDMKEDLAAAHRMIKELEGQLEVERMAKNVYEAKTTNLEAGLEAIIIRLAKLEEAKNQS